MTDSEQMDQLRRDIGDSMEEAILDAFYEHATRSIPGVKIEHKVGHKSCPTNHNQQCQFTHGFFCEDCCTFFPRDSPTYRRSKLLESIWMVLHNINAESLQAGGPEIPDAIAMRDKIGVHAEHEDYEVLITEAEVVMAKYGVNVDSATISIG